jgi:hypothetical protein
MSAVERGFEMRSVFKVLLVQIFVASLARIRAKIMGGVCLRRRYILFLLARSENRTNGDQQHSCRCPHDS